MSDGVRSDDDTAGVAVASASFGVGVGVGADAEDLRAIRSRVLNVVGHELRTPVTTLRGLADALTQQDAATVEAEVIPALQRSARRLERLVDDLLVANGITTALPVGQHEPVDVTAVARSVWSGLAGAGDLAVEVDGGPAVPVLVSAPLAAVRGALERVLENAHVLGDAPPTVRVQRRDGEIVIAVDSPGAVLHPEEIRLAAELLFRGEAAVMRAPGLGLGLTIAKALAQHAGGRLHLASREGGGLITSVCLPEPVA